MARVNDETTQVQPAARAGSPLSGVWGQLAFGVLGRSQGSRNAALGSSLRHSQAPHPAAARLGCPGDNRRCIGQEGGCSAPQMRSLNETIFMIVQQLDLTNTCFTRDYLLSHPIKAYCNQISSIYNYKSNAPLVH